MVGYSPAFPKPEEQHLLGRQCASASYRSIQDFIYMNGTTTMSWPAQSPHLNIIENL